MRNEPFRRSLALAVIAAGMLSSAAASASQLQERVIKKYSWRSEPVKLVKLTVKGKPAELGRKMLADDDWFKGLTVGVKNVSPKTITFIELLLEFPPPEGLPQGRPSRDRLMYGQYPLAPGASPPPSAEHPVRPGETVTVVLSDYEGLREFLRRAGQPSSIRQLELSIDRVIFDDGTMWSKDRWFRRDGSDPDKWETVEPPSEAVRLPGGGFFFLASHYSGAGMAPDSARRSRRTRAA